MKKMVLVFLALALLCIMAVPAVAEEEVTVKQYSVIINSSMSLENMVKAGNYDLVNNDITTENFPAQGESGEVVIELLYFNQTISTEDVLAKMKRLGVRPATLRELLAFGSTYPNVQREFVVIALSSMWQYPLGDRNIAFLLHGDDSLRQLDFQFIFYDWRNECLFAAVRKPA